MCAGTRQGEMYAAVHVYNLIHIGTPGTLVFDTAAPLSGIRGLRGHSCRTSRHLRQVDQQGERRGITLRVAERYIREYCQTQRFWVCATPQSTPRPPNRAEIIDLVGDHPGGLRFGSGGDVFFSSSPLRLRRLSHSS